MGTRLACCWCCTLWIGICTNLTFAQASYDEKNEPVTVIRKSCVALTFDDGPDVTLTPLLLSILAREQVRATFYLVGSRVAMWPNIVREILNNGNEVGNHSWSHSQFSLLTPSEIRLEITKTDNAIEDATGVRPKTLRAPYDDLNDKIKQLFRRPFIFWDVDTEDWKHRSSKRVADVAISNSRDGSIVLLHDIHRTTVNAVETIISGLKLRRFKFVTISELSTPLCKS